MKKQSTPTEEKPAKQENKPSNPNVRARQRGIGIVELLFAATTLSTTVLVAAMSYTKKPPMSGD